ncbi:MAG: response regulator [Vallitaleaceae bacterium]|jgi:two-component system chemotaxis response regulator CheY|nr:response regulator [Vallitaleaceae bacterium]
MLFTGKVVMIVDDSYTIRHQVRLLLSKYDIIVIEAHNKTSMLNHLLYKGQLVDLILMDLGLKETSGFDLMEFLQATPNYKHIPIIVLTGDATKNTVLEAASAFKIEHYAIKPIDPISLSNKVLTVLEKQHFSNHSNMNPEVAERLKTHKKEQLSKDANKSASSDENSKATDPNPNHIEKILKSTLTNPKTEPDSNKPQKDKMHTNIDNINKRLQ